MIDLGPFLDRVNAGEDPEEAWEKAQPDIAELAEYGTWSRDYFLTGPDKDSEFCHIGEIKCALRRL
jgi:hypothetical protein